MTDDEHVIIETTVNFITLFTGRTDAYGSWTGGKIDADILSPSGFTNPLCDHLWNGPHIGVYPQTDDSTVGWGCIDLDGKDFPIPNIDGTHNGASATDWDAMWTLAALLQDVLAYKDCTAWLERTANGIHVWVFADERVPAAIMRRALLVACQVAEYKPKEVNPKSEGVGFVHEYDCPNGPVMASRTARGRRMLQHSSPEGEGSPHGEDEAGDDGPRCGGEGPQADGYRDDARPVRWEAGLEAPLGMGGSEEGRRDRPTGSVAAPHGAATPGAHQRMPGCREGCRDSGKTYSNYVRLPYYGALAAGTPKDRFVVDEDGLPMDVHHFSRTAMGSRNPVGTLEDMATMYAPPPTITSVSFDQATEEAFRQLEPILPPVVELIFRDGPLDGRRGKAYVKVALLLRDDGWQAQAIYTVVRALDSRLGKFVDRPDRETYLLGVLESAGVYEQAVPAVANRWDEPF